MIDFNCVTVVYLLQECMFESSPDDVHISYLPLAHMFERVCMVCMYVCMYVCVYVCVYVTMSHSHAKVELMMRKLECGSSSY